MQHLNTTDVLSLPYPALLRRIGKRAATAGITALLGLTVWASSLHATTLADQPVFASADVPGNLALVLSVEYPTANSVANLNAYADTMQYLGYFDPNKCYSYVPVPPSGAITDYSASYFQPNGAATGSNQHQCSSQWSGNFMNWAAMQTIDPFRWALTGGYRSPGSDSIGLTILEKAWQSGQGGTANYPDRGTDQPSTAVPANTVATSLVPALTPFSWGNFNVRIAGNGNRMVFTGHPGSLTAITNTLGSTPADLSMASPSTGANSSFTYQVYVRIKVCDPTAGVETNCQPYGTGNYKPEGLLQQYANKIRYSDLSYLNSDGATQQGGVLRAPMGFIGPTYPTPLSATVTVNPKAEWSSVTGIMNVNPDSVTASGSGVTQSGVMNYLNKFGEYGHSYMLDDNVSELYYAAVRYFENLGNVSQWDSSPTSNQLDGFPAVSTWSDPIAYSCQKNFILGIGDDHTHVDYNVGGGTYTGGRVKPAVVASDSFNQAHSWTQKLQTLEGITPNDYWAAGAGDATYYIAGLAYGAHVLDIRPDLGTKDASGNKTSAISTISTYWMDVMEYQRAEDLNPYYLASKYGGFAVPSGYSINNTTPLTQSWWDTTNNTIMMGPTGSQVSRNQPDNYYLAGNATQMVNGVRAAFANIASASNGYTTSLSLASPTVTASGTTSFAAQYNSVGWTGTITASTITFAADGTPTVAKPPLWTSDTTLNTQLQASGTGWDTGRVVVTWSGGGGVAFRAGNLAAQTAALTPAYSPATTPTDYVNYLRGDQFNEVGSTLLRTGKTSTHSLRARTLLLGDIIDSKVTAVAAPAMSYSDSTNPGYALFKNTTWASRPTMGYVGANDGMLHAFVGTTGYEQFAYVPSAVIQGPNNTPQVDGLAQLGNPNYLHHFYVDATPLAFDIDLNNSGGAFATTNAGNSGWITLLVGGLGKGGKSFYAIDVTDPANMNSEGAVATKVKWEYADPTMGYSYGNPMSVKTAKYGWVVALTSGYNNSDGYGYVYLLNPRTGALLEKIKTPSLSNGLTQASPYVQDYTDYTADSIYAGDLNGQVWRFDLTQPKGTATPYPAPTLLAHLTDASGNAQPVTSAPLIEIYPTTRKRYVMVGTGQLLSSADVPSTAPQTFYSIVDGTASHFNVVPVPITRLSLTAVTDVLAGVPAASTTGWYIDLGSDVASGVAWRLVNSPVTYNGVVAFTPLLTKNDPCNPGGNSRVYVVDYSAGKSVLPASTFPAGYYAPPSQVDDARFLKENGKVELVVGDTVGDVLKVATNPLNNIATRLLNWREIPTAD